LDRPAFRRAIQDCFVGTVTVAGNVSGRAAVGGAISGTTGFFLKKLNMSGRQWKLQADARRRRARGVPAILPEHLPGSGC
jgi:hypothetical protein